MKIVDSSTTSVREPETSNLQSSVFDLQSRGRLLLAGALLLLIAAVWTEPAGSWLGEPDEARYAEIPREMLATHDFVTPRLNGVPYLEKPPLLYWCNAAAFQLFGQTPWAARLTARLAGTATVAILIAGVASISNLDWGLAAGIFYLLSPLGFVLSRLNVTDGLLTLFLTATLFAARETLRRREAGRSAAGWAALAGAATAGAFLSKGLIAIVLPGGILVLTCLVTKRVRWLPSLLLSPAPLIFLALCLPWLVLVERRNPGFSRFFFIHEHFQRFATGQAQRGGPIFYFVGIFLGGFLPGLPFFFAALRRRRAGDTPPWLAGTEFLFFLFWFLVMFLFFSVSSSKLPPYLLPAFPAAAAIAARGLGHAGNVRRWRVAAVVASLLPLAAFIPRVTRWIVKYELLPMALPGLALLLICPWIASFAARRSVPAALALLATGWSAFYIAAALCWPHIPQATVSHNMEIVVRDLAARSNARVVGYSVYLQGVPWELKHPIPVADYFGELEPQFEQDAHVREALYWTRDRFWREWKSREKMLALVRTQNLGEFAGDRIIRRERKFTLVANF